MKINSFYQRLVGFIICVFIYNLHSFGQLRLRQVYPHLVLNEIEIKWDAVPAAQEYEFRFKENSGAYSAWTSVGTSTSYLHTGLTAASTYTYQVRVKVAGVITDTSNEKSNSFRRIWPVRKTDGTESVKLMHGFGQPYGTTTDPPVGLGKFFHEGIDINGEGNVDNELVVAPMGGILRFAGDGSGGTDLRNFVVNLEVSINGDIHYIQFNHLKGIPNSLTTAPAGITSVAAGDTLGFILDPVGGFNTTRSSHTHCHFWKRAGNTPVDPNYQTDLLPNAMNPFNIWDINTYRDPQGNLPTVKDTNGDGDTITFRKTPNSGATFPKDGKVHNGVDLVVEAVDKQSSDTPYQVPKVVGYYIQRQENGTWQDAVRSSLQPYVLVDNNIYYQSNNVNHNDGVVATIIDTNSTLRSRKPNPTPPDYIWEQWFTYKVTNTKGTSGAIADLDSNQYWATDARKTVAEPNGYKDKYDSARAIDEAKFPDGNYRVNIRLADFIQTSPDYQKEIQVDNFRPYAKKVEIKSGKLNYVAEWKWDEAKGELALDDNKDTAKASGKITIRITFSEPMKDANIDIYPLSYFFSTPTPVAGTDRKVWEFEVPRATTDGAVEGPHRLTIDGHDMADNVLQGFITKDAKPGAALHKRRLDGSWFPTDAPVKDTIHHFKIETKADIEFVVDDTGSMGEEIAGVRNSILQILNLPLFADNTAGWKFQLTTFKDNVTVRPITTDLTLIRNQVAALVASGGGDCPEASVEAVEAIKNNVKDNGVVFLFTDASPHGGTNITGVTAELKAKGINLSVLLSGDCTGFLRSSQGGDQIPYSDNHDSPAGPAISSLSDNPTAVEAYSYMAGETGGVFAFVPEVNGGVAIDRLRYENIAFNIIIGAITAAITNSEPAKGPVGGTLALTISGSKTRFNSSTTISFTDPGIVVNQLTVISPTKLQATVTIGTSVPLGLKDIKSSTDIGGGIIDTTAGGKGLLQVIAAPTTPTILSISPVSGQIGQLLTVKVTGINTHFTNASVLNLGSGISILNITALSAVELQAQIQIASTAAIGFRNVTVTTGTEVATENVPGPFLVTAELTPDSCDLSTLSLGPDKTVNLFYPDSACTTLSVSGLDSTATGAYSFVWSTGDTTAAISVCPTTTTSYTVSVTKESCTFTDTVKVNVNRCPGDILIAAPSCSGKATIAWTEPRDTFPGTISIPASLDPGSGTLSYIGGLDGHGYYRSNQTYPWPVARDISGYLGGTGVQGHLATITSSAENNLIFNSINGSGHSPWIGLFNAGRSGRFRWVGNEALEYTNWAPGEPNNYGGNAGNVAEPYVHMVETTGTWNDWVNNNLTFITEFEKPLIRYKQISGPRNGTEHKVGTYLICYERTNMITDQKDTCCFTVTVTCSGSIPCPKDTIIVAASCTGTTTIAWTEPKDTFPNMITIPASLDPGSGTLNYIGGLDGHGYYLSNQTYLWPVARDISGYLGGTGVQGHLATITSAAENAFLFNRINGSGHSPWIGLFNTGRPGRFRWVGNEDLGYTNWTPGDPNNYGGNAGNVAEPYVLMFEGTGTWYDWGNNHLTFLTEFEKPLIRYKQIAGPKNGSEQKEGVYLICYEKTDMITDQKDTCCFTVTIACDADAALMVKATSSMVVPEMAEGTNSVTADERDSKLFKATSSEGLHVIAYPNPSHNHFTLSITSDNIKEQVSVQVVDAIGRMVETRKNVTPNMTLQMGNTFKPGIYFLQIMQGTRKVRMKLIKQVN